MAEAPTGHSASVHLVTATRARNRTSSASCGGTAWARLAETAEGLGPSVGRRTAGRRRGPLGSHSLLVVVALLDGGGLDGALVGRAVIRLDRPQSMILSMLAS